MRSTRRRFVAGLGATGLTILTGCGASPPARGSPPKPHRVTYLSGNPIAGGETIAAFRQSMRELGYVEGQNLIVDERHANGNDQLAGPVAELVQLRPDVILTASAVVAQAVRGGTTTIPIVSAGQGDLLTSGLVASAARPGGSVTGQSTPPLSGRQVQTFQEAYPTLSRIAVLLDSTQPGFVRETYDAPARTLGLPLELVSTSGEGDLEAALDAAVQARADGLIVGNGPVLTANAARIGELSIARRLPTMWNQREGVIRGGLLAYGPNRVDQYRRAAVFVDKIIKGANPGDLPIELPILFDFAINLKTAQALGITLPPAVLAQATEIIQ